MKKSLKEVFQNLFRRTGKPGAVDVALETPRLTLREIELTDKKRLMEITNTPGFAHYCFDGSEEKVDTFLKKCLDNRKPNPATGLRDYIMLAICDKTTGVFLGCISLEHKSFVTGVDYEINFFMDQNHQNKGYGREASVNLMRYAFEDMNLPAINVTIEPRNGPSLNVAAKEGYKDTGVIVDISTPCFGTRPFKVLILEKSGFYEQRKGDKVPLMLPRKSSNDNKKPSDKKFKP